MSVVMIMTGVVVIVTGVVIMTGDECCCDYDW